MRDDLVGRAEKLLARRSESKRPLFIELTGSPSSGKTTIKKILDTFFRRRGYRVAVPQEGAEVIRHISRKTPLYNIRTGMYALTLLMDFEVDQNYDLVIFDRALFDAFSWMEYWARKGSLTQEERSRYQEYFTDRRWLDKLDASFIVVASPEAVESREREINLTDEDGATTNPKSILLLTDIYRETYKRFSPERGTIQLVDTTKLSKKEMAFDVLEHALESFERTYNNLR